MAGPIKTGILNRGTNSSNLYIDVNKQGAGTLTGENVDQKLVSAKVERLLAFREEMSREINPAAESTLHSAGQINASWVEAEILTTQVSVYVEEAFYKGTSIPDITVFRSDIISGKHTVTRKIDYKDCYITKVFTSVETDEGENLSSLRFWFRFSQRQNTRYDFDQAARPIGQQVSYIDFTKGSLQPSGGGGGEGGGGGGGGLPA
jgi:hypothetical protein